MERTNSSRSLTMPSMMAKASPSSTASSPSFLMASSGLVPTAISLRIAGRASLANLPCFKSSKEWTRQSSGIAVASTPSRSISLKVFRRVVAAMGAMDLSSESLSKSSSWLCLTI